MKKEIARCHQIFVQVGVDDTISDLERRVVRLQARQRLVLLRTIQLEKWPQDREESDTEEKKAEEEESDSEEKKGETEEEEKKEDVQ